MHQLNREIKNNMLHSAALKVMEYGADISVLFKGYFLPKGDSSGNRIIHYYKNPNGGIDYRYDHGYGCYTGTFTRQELCERIALLNEKLLSA